MNNVYIEKIINIRRVAKVVKGGRRFSFSALVVVGNSKNKIGFGLGKAKEVSEAIVKGKVKALKNMIKFSILNNTIPHKIVGRFNTSLVIMIPTSIGTGIIAGNVMRSIFEVTGIKDILSKSIKSKNSGNILRATIDGLLKLKLYSEKSEQLKKII